MNGVLLPRGYQKELLEVSKEKNAIICLGTGTGKTVIAVMLIRELSHDLRLPYDEGGKRTVLLVPLVALVRQHARLIDKYTDLKVGCYSGELGAGSWTKETWEREFQLHHVLVITAEVFRMALKSDFVSLTKINLLIIDECHRAVGHHPYRDVMIMLAETPEHSRPQILGLTASVVNGKCLPEKLSFEIMKLQNTMLCNVITASDLDAVNRFGTKPKEVIVVFKGLEMQGFPLEDVIQYLDYIHHFLAEVKSTVFENTTYIKYKQLPRYIAQIRDVFLTLGPWCAYESTKILRWTIEDLSAYSRDQSSYVQKLLQVTKSAVEFVSLMCKKLFSKANENEIEALIFASPQLLKLLSIIKASKSVLQRGIIFVEKRYIATLVYLWLKEVMETCSGLDFAKPCAVVGHGLGPSSGLALKMSVRKQERILQNFRDGRFNLLVATSVVEEGLDVPNCNLVVRFDLPVTFRSYIQSKGRARAAEAKYVMLVEKNLLSKFQAHYDIYLDTERILYKQCQNRKVESSEASKQEHNGKECKSENLEVNGGALANMLNETLKVDDDQDTSDEELQGDHDFNTEQQKGQNVKQSNELKQNTFDETKEEFFWQDSSSDQLYEFMTSIHSAV